MKFRRSSATITWFALALIPAVSVLGLTLHGGAPTIAVAAAEDAAGHCVFSLKNQWVGPLKACMSPTSAAQCSELGKKDENSNAQFAAGACPGENVVGVCRMEQASLTYYEGDASGLEVGCGFQSGTWSTPAK
jgi:hypothetical protein